MAQANGMFRRRPDINCALHTHIAAANKLALPDSPATSDHQQTRQQDKNAFHV
ncbi:hypothetical protein ACMAZH_08980 [Arenicellales bacterium nBUS_45]